MPVERDNVNKSYVSSCWCSLELLLQRPCLVLDGEKSGQGPWRTQRRVKDLLLVKAHPGFMPLVRQEPARHRRHGGARGCVAPFASWLHYLGNLYHLSISVLCAKGVPVPLGPHYLHAVVAHAVVFQPPNPSWCLFCCSPDHTGLRSAPCSYEMLR